MRHVMDFYHQTFCNDIEAMRYLQERRCFNAEATKAFQIGYANRTLGYRVPPTRRRRASSSKHNCNGSASCATAVMNT